MAIQQGTRLDHFEIAESVGAGGMGEVYRARDTRLGRDVAVKVLPSSMAKDADRMARFEQEARAAGMLNHPNLLVLHDIGTYEGAPYLVTELLEGETLADMLQEGALPERRAVDYAAQVARGLAAVHEKGVVHRDLKPGNLFITRDGRVKILDFGLAKLHGSANSDEMETVARSLAPVTEAGSVLGTVGYMSPEQVRGEGADHRSDIFSLGIVLYEMLSGQRPFQAATAAETMTAILRHEPTELPTVDPEITPALDRLVHHCLEKTPEQRYQSAGDLAFELEGRSWRTSSGMAAVVDDPGTGRRGTWKTAVLVAAVVLLPAAAFLLGRMAAPAEGPQAGNVSFQRQTFRRGNVLRARLAPDGKNIVFSAAWEDAPAELFQTRTDSPGSRPLELKGADVLSISSRGEMAVLLKDKFLGTTSGGGTLARVPLAGGAPREVLRDVVFADWGPDGESLAVVRRHPDGMRLEYPIGNVLRQGYAGFIRVSPDGEHVAFQVVSGATSELWVVDRSGESRVLSSGWPYLGEGLLWSPSGDEVLFTAGDSERGALRAVDLSGNERVLHATSDPWVLHDITTDGRILMEREVYRIQAIHGSASSDVERDLSWLDQSRLVNFTRDGNTVLFTDTSEGEPGIYLRSADGSPAVFLGEGYPRDLSPDGRWVLLGEPDAVGLTLLPTGAGEARDLETGDLVPSFAYFRNETEIRFAGASAGQEDPNFYALSIDDGVPRRLGLVPERRFNLRNTWDGSQFVNSDGDEVILSSLDGSSESRIGGFEPGLRILQVSADSRWLYVARRGELPLRVQRFDLETGTLEPWQELMPQDSTGIIRVDEVLITPGGEAYAYEAVRVTASDLYLVDGLF
jgi:Tol biopolymer transport system component